MDDFIKRSEGVDDANNNNDNESGTIAAVLLFNKSTINARSYRSHKCEFG